MSQSTKAKKNLLRSICTVSNSLSDSEIQGESSAPNSWARFARFQNPGLFLPLSDFPVSPVSRLFSSRSAIISGHLLLLIFSGTPLPGLAENNSKGDIRAQLKDTLTDESNQNISSDTVTSVLEGLEPEETEAEKQEQALLDEETKPSPEELSLREELNEFFKYFQQEANPLLMMNRVDWEEAYRYLSPIRKQNLGLNSPNLARKYYMDYFTNPRALSSYLLARNLSQLPEEKRQAVRMVYEREPLKRNPPKKVEGLNSTRFKVMTTRINGELARVSIKIRKGKDSQNQNLSLKKNGDTWLFICPYLIDDPLDLCDLAS